MAKVKTDDAKPADPLAGPALAPAAPAAPAVAPVDAGPVSEPVLAPPVPAPAPATRKARVTVPGTHVGTIEVEIDASLAGPDADAAAIKAAKEARGIVTFGAGPQVELL